MYIAVVAGGEVPVTDKHYTGQQHTNASTDLLKDVMMEFFTPLATSFLFHCPMQGPQALASTDPPAFSRMAVDGVMVKYRFKEQKQTELCFRKKKKTKHCGSARAVHSPWMPSRSIVARTCSDPGVMLPPASR